MSTPTLLLPPDSARYDALINESGVISVKLNGGASRFRADQQGAVFTVKAQWTCDQVNYSYLLAFYRTAVNYGSLPFNINLTLDGNLLDTYVAHFVPDTFELTGQSGLTWIVQADLEVIPNAAYAANDAAILAAGPDE